VVLCFTNNTTIDNGDGLIAVNQGKLLPVYLGLGSGGICQPGVGVDAVQLSGSLP